MKNQKIQPRKNQILVRPDGEESRELGSGLLLPNAVEQEQKAIGTVIAVGPEISDVKKGDRVIYGAYAGEVIKMREDSKEVEYKLLFDEDVLAFIK